MCTHAAILAQSPNAPTHRGGAHQPNTLVANCTPKPFSEGQVTANTGTCSVPKSGIKKPGRMADRPPYPASPPSTIGVATGPSAPLSFAAFKNNTTDGIQASRRRSRRTRNSARPGSDASSPSSSLEEDRIWGAQRLRTSPSQPLIRRVDDNSPSHLHEHYRLGSVLGTGAFSIVRTALERRTGKFWACKIMRLPSDDKVVEAQAMRSESTYSTTRQEVSNEVAGMLAAGPHPNVLTLHECFEERGRIYLLTQVPLAIIDSQFMPVPSRLGHFAWRRLRRYKYHHLFPRNCLPAGTTSGSESWGCVYLRGRPADLCTVFGHRFRSVGIC